MGIPKVRRAKGAAKPKGLPTKPPAGKPTVPAKAKKGAAKAAAKTEKEVAEEAVQEFEGQHETLKQMRADWEETYSDAVEAQAEVLEQEDVVTSAIARAKPLVAAAKETIGPFKVTIKHSTAKYDETAVTDILKEQENAGEIVQEMLDAGVITSFNFDKNTVIAWIAKNPEYSELFQKAWRDRAPMTPAVTVPKI
jgi:hypothetical protein